MKIRVEKAEKQSYPQAASSVLFRGDASHLSLPSDPETRK